jgi:hypothetical protein
MSGIEGSLLVYLPSWLGSGRHGGDRRGKPVAESTSRQGSAAAAHLAFLSVGSEVARDGGSRDLKGVRITSDQLRLSTEEALYRFSTTAHQVRPSSPTVYRRRDGHGSNYARGQPLSEF